MLYVVSSVASHLVCQLHHIRVFVEVVVFQVHLELLVANLIAMGIMLDFLAVLKVAETSKLVEMSPESDTEVDQG